jgi:ureidoacrylate peracid hydrolase
LSVKKEWESVKKYLGSQLWAKNSIPPIKLKADKVALVIVDMQYLDAHTDYGMGAIAKKEGFAHEFDWYFHEMPRIIRNQQALIKVCREKNIEVIYTRICGLTKDGRDTSYFYSFTLPIVTPIDSKEAQVLDDIKPAEDDIVIVKTTDSAFNSQYNTDRILRNMGIQQLLICGVVTNGCVEGTVRDAADFGYDVITIGDSSLAFTEVQHEFALMEQALFYARIKNTKEVLSELSQLDRATSKSKLKQVVLSIPA